MNEIGVAVHQRAKLDFFVKQGVGISNGINARIYRLIRVINTERRIVGCNVVRFFVYGDRVQAVVVFGDCVRFVLIVVQITVFTHQKNDFIHRHFARGYVFRVMRSGTVRKGAHRVVLGRKEHLQRHCCQIRVKTVFHKRADRSRFCIVKHLYRAVYDLVGFAFHAVANEHHNRVVQ